MDVLNSEHPLLLPCTFCMEREGRMIDNPKIAKFICKEYGIKAETVFGFDVLDPPEQSNPLAFPLCSTCTPLFEEMGRIQIVSEEIKGKLNMILSEIQGRVVGKSSDDEIVSSNCRILRHEIIRSPISVLHEETRKRPSMMNTELNAKKVKLTMREQMTANIAPTSQFEGNIMPEDNENGVKVDAEQDVHYAPNNEAITMNTSNTHMEVDVNINQDDQPSSSSSKLEVTADLEDKSKDEGSSELEAMHNEWKLKYTNHRGRCRFCMTTSNSADVLRAHEIKDHQDRLVHQCASCGEKYSSASILGIHNEIHNTSGPYKCLCSATLENSYQLQIHILQNHIPVEPIVFREHNTETVCLICKKQFASNGLLAAHVRFLHNKKKFMCELCPGLSFSKAKGLINHLLDVHETGEKTLSCPKCTKQFVTDYMLYKHVSSHSLQWTNQLICEVCFRTFQNNDQIRLEHHMKAHNKSSAPRAPALLATSLPDPTAPNRTRHECPGVNCDQSFSRKIQLRNHEIKSHPELFIYLCKLCDKKYSMEVFLEAHARTHSDIDSLGGFFQCTICLKKFLSGNELTNHLYAHTGGASPCCGECSAEFETKRQLHRHWVTEHSKDKV